MASAPQPSRGYGRPEPGPRPAGRLWTRSRPVLGVAEDMDRHVTSARTLLVLVVSLLVVVTGTAAVVEHRTEADRADGTTATQFGAAFQRESRETYDQALARVDETLDLELVRVFYGESPEPWPGKALGRDVVVSFKLDPAEVLAGEHDAQMRRWFATAPRNIDVNWVYWHEPEDDIESSAFTAEEFTGAFARLDAIADEASNPRLVSTLVLMSWTTNPASGRDWRDYFPPDEAVDVFAWDVYNRSADEGVYSDPADLLDAPRLAAASVGKPFAVAELGSTLVDGDDGTGRAAWLLDMGEYLLEHDTVFVSYFDFSWNSGADDYRLRDAPSVQAWRELSGTPLEDGERNAGKRPALLSPTRPDS